MSYEAEWYFYALVGATKPTLYLLSLILYPISKIVYPVSRILYLGSSIQSTLDYWKLIVDTWIFTQMQKLEVKTKK